MDTGTCPIGGIVRKARFVLVSAVVAVVMLGVVSPPASAVPSATPDSSSCPELTDSIKRLYSAYFLRDPDPGGFQYWLEIYSGPHGGLDVMSNSFADSSEFRQTYGSLTNADFVQLVYQNVLGREADQGGFDHWLNALNTGFTRGELMISFSESQEYVTRTDTSAPLAGYLTWYDGSVQFDCGFGDKTTSFSSLPPTAHADAMRLNLNDTTEINTVLAVNRADGGVETDPVSVAADFYYIQWNSPIYVANPVSFSFSSNAAVPTDFFWLIVVYDEPHSATRLPYTNNSGAGLHLGTR